jgi:hypothetical protein
MGKLKGMIAAVAAEGSWRKRMPTWMDRLTKSDPAIASEIGEQLDEVARGEGGVPVLTLTRVLNQYIQTECSNGFQTIGRQAVQQEIDRRKEAITQGSAKGGTAKPTRTNRKRSR